MLFKALHNKINYNRNYLSQQAQQQVQARVFFLKQRADLNSNNYVIKFRYI